MIGHAYGSCVTTVVSAPAVFCWSQKGFLPGDNKLQPIPSVDPSKPAPRARPKKVDVIVERCGNDELRVAVTTKSLQTVVEFGEQHHLSSSVAGDNVRDAMYQIQRTRCNVPECNVPHATYQMHFI